MATTQGTRPLLITTLATDLRSAQARIDDAYRERSLRVFAAKRQGMTNIEIGVSLGLTEGAVRAIIKAGADLS
ncbi:helix-turn-helix DNA-binding domain protein [Arthrobacter phage Abba]|uniref:Helix-turn-helix DNA-binding domain protein n=1 Tax=Arthrobacter phage Abba TaxID=2713256 RepID=A0A6G8R2D8_9CAUD|nr:HTH DNA binding protein [Arthrobacter phage Abba]QIN94367.1 helix-turn-helix DNA-binding domain protein [Arthrobacter phage Abba]